MRKETPGSGDEDEKVEGWSGKAIHVLSKLAVRTGESGGREVVKLDASHSAESTWVSLRKSEGVDEAGTG
jgi:hypothetical protein